MYSLVCYYVQSLLPPENRIGAVKVSVVASNAADRGSEPRSGQSNQIIWNDLCFFFSTEHATLREKSKGWLDQNRELE